MLQRVEEVETQPQQSPPGMHLSSKVHQREIKLLKEKLTSQGELSEWSLPLNAADDEDPDGIGEETEIQIGRRQMTRRSCWKGERDKKFKSPTMMMRTLNGSGDQRQTLSQVTMAHWVTASLHNNEEKPKTSWTASRGQNEGMLAQTVRRSAKMMALRI